ncbi:DNA-binding response regulator, NarL/FixJ family, contains REC and HTH domains [Lentzea waywayandensis]|uniref:DNA-binding response regulator, NarL/FixJ family, contains REC and HTH domains n=1 Tax=Lentzea waywayandensis TaxID=84724 RepID=A0A1I6FEB8_9PSEU|nr:helix-turn-helix transcriptional regulator [Lentzea waywayandensis]SFR28222.1 DNA-binding response regulator, NarL/FixJ family, contains REC and HTH domains [Lentzea waywayandensis]
MTNNGLLDEVRRTRFELVRSGRWNEADQLARDAVPGLEPAAVAYLPGLPKARGRSDPDLFRAVQAANRGTGRAEASGIAQRVLASAGSLDAGTFWQALTVLIHADEVALAHRYWAAATGHDLLGGRVMLLRGDPRAAVRLLDGALGRGIRPRVVAVAWLVLALRETGEFARAHAVLETERLTGPLPERPDSAELCFARGRLLLAQGQSALALDDFLDCGRRLATWGVVNPAVVPWRSSAALAAADLGDLVLARICADKDLVAARRWGGPRGIGLALHACALARGGDDVLLEEALTCLGRASTAGEALRARHDLAQLLLARGAIERAREHTRRLREAKFCPQWTREADVLASRLLRNDGESALSGQERRIALMARSGRSNREIAAELGLTVRTVEIHLTAVYRKMGVAGRPGLRRALVPTA